MFSKIDVTLLTNVFQIFNNVSYEQYDINQFYCLSLAGYTWGCGMRHTNIMF